MDTSKGPAAKLPSRTSRRAAAAALRNSEARANEALERERAARAEAEQARSRLEAIQYVTDAALAQLRLDELLPELLARIRSVLHSDSATVLLLDEDLRYLTLRASVGLEMPRAQLKIPLGQGVAGRVALQQTPLTVDDLADVELLDDTLRRHLRSLAAVPLAVTGRTVGVLHVGTIERRKFGADDVSLLQLVADRAALAIENARLYERAQFEQTRWRATVENMLDPVTVSDADGHAVYMNAAYTRMVNRTIELGLSLDEHAEHYQLYRPDGTLFEPDDLPLQKAAREGADAANVEIIQRTPSGEDRVAIWNAAPLRGPDGRVIGAVAIGHDISEQRQAEAAQERLMAEIRSSHRTLETLIETMQVGVIFCNSAGEITLTNPAAAAMFRGPLTGDAYGPQGSYTLNLPDGRPYPPEELPLPRALRGEVTGQVEILVRRSDGEEVWLWVAGRPIREGSGKIIGAVASMIDISELKQSEAALQEAHDQLELRVKERTQELSLREASLRDTARALEEANAQLQRLSRRLVQVQEDERRDIARELHDEAGQLLTAMKVGLTLLERDIPAMSDAIAARIGELKAAAEEAQESLHGLAVNLRPAVLDRVGVAAAVRQYLETFERRTGMQVDFVEMGMNQQRLSKEIELALYRVVQETLTNVMRHAQATAVGVIIERRDDVIIAIVEDNGVGFDPEADAAGGRLGLFGMQERVETVGGHMTVESAPGRGTTVYVQIPLQEGARLSDTAVPYSRSA